MGVSSALGSSALLPAGLGFRNKIINGNMVVAQRGASAVSNSANANTYAGPDRWHVFGSSASKMTLAQSTIVPAGEGFTNSVLVTSSAATTPGASEYYGVRQYIEGYNVADLAYGASGAKQVVISFWVRSSVTGTYSLTLHNSGSNRSYISTYTVNVQNTWEKKSIVVFGDTSGTWLTNNGIGLAVWFDLGSGSSNNGTAGTWASGLPTRTSGSVTFVSTNGATFYLTGVQVEQNYQPTPFEQRPFGVELALCQRYYEKSYDTDTAPNSNTNNGLVYFSGSTDNNGQIFYPVIFKVPKRSTNYQIAFNINTGASAGNWQYNRSGASANTAMTNYLPGNNGFIALSGNIGVGWVAANLVGHWACNAEL